MKKRLLSMLMLCCLALSLLPVTALAEPEETEPDSVPISVEERVSEPVSTQGSGDRNDDLFYQYMLRQAGGDQDSVSLFSVDDPAYNRLNDGTCATGKYEKAIYTELKKHIEAVAAGTETSTEFVLLADDLGMPQKWTSEDLFPDDPTRPIIVGGSIDSDAVNNLWEQIGSVDDILAALRADCPFELYWYDIEYGTSSNVYNPSASGTKTLFIDGITIKMYVSVDYAAVDSDTGVPEDFILDADLVTQANTAWQNAKKVVDGESSIGSLAGMSDYQKLLAYKNYICSQVSYNYTAADPATRPPYGDPWQLIWVFDGDDSTDVVCEGYSKAFQLLCDLSGFTNTRCYIVTGTMNGRGHMWNVVTMPDGKNYLVDVTNCDSGMAGYQDKLFLKAVEMQKDEGIPTGFTITIYDTITYVYDVRTDNTSSMVEVWGADVLDLCGTDYGECVVNYDAGPGWVDEAKENHTGQVTYYHSTPASALLTPYAWGEHADKITYKWMKDGVALSDEDTAKICSGTYGDKVASEVALTAEWTCGVTFDPNGEGSSIASSDANQQVVYNTEITMPNATRSNSYGPYTLEGWYTAATGGTRKGGAGDSYTVKDADTFYAHWNCNLTLDAKGGTLKNKTGSTAASITESIPESSTWSQVKARTDLTWNGEDPTRDGYKFDQWYTSADWTEPLTDSLVFNHNSTVYARWNCDLTLDANGGKLNDGTAATLTETVPEGTKWSELSTLTGLTWDGNNPTRDGYTFDGWYTAAGGGTKVEDAYSVNNAATLYAHWIFGGCTLKVPASTEEVDCYYKDGKVFLNGTGVSDTKPVLVASYHGGQMLTLVFIKTNSDSVVIPSDAETVKVFWVDASGGFVPRCENGMLNLTTGT